MPRTHRRINVAAQLAAQLFDEAAAWRETGDLANEQKALEAGYALLEREGLGSPEEARERSSESVPFTVEEEKQADLDDAAAVERAKEEAVSAAEQAALVTKLAAGTATAAETQAALAQLLGGG